MVWRKTHVGVWTSRLRISRSVVGLKPPRGILLHRPPDTGKTHFARAIPALTGSAVLIVDCPELPSAYHSETDAKIRGVFAAVRSRSPCIIVLGALCPWDEDGPGREARRRSAADADGP